MHFIKTNGLTLTAADRTLIEPITIVLRGRIGLTGENGSGKSTLLRALAYDPQVFRSGRTLLQSQESAGTVSDLLEITGTLAAIDRVQSGQSLRGDEEMVEDQWSLPQRARAALAASGLAEIDLTRKASTLSGGERARVIRASMLLHEAQILLLDEPTNHLDAQGRAEFYQFLEDYDGTAVIASHDRELLRRMDGILEIRAERARYYEGGFETYAAQRESEILRAEHARAASARESRKARREKEELISRQIKRERSARARAPDAGIPRVALGLLKRNAEKTRGRIAKKADAQIRETERVRSEAAHDARRRKTWAIKPAESKAEGLILAARNLNANVQGRSLWPAPISFAIHAGDRLRIKGKNGSGKSTLCAILLGTEEQEISWRGDIHRHAAIALLDQNGRAVRMEPNGLIEHHVPLVHNRTVMSGGERMHAALRWILESGAGILLLDEPTNHLDVDRVLALEKTLESFEGALVLISHDEDFAENVGCTAVIDLDAAGDF